MEVALANLDPKLMTIDLFATRISNCLALCDFVAVVMKGSINSYIFN